MNDFGRGVFKVHGENIFSSREENQSSASQYYLKSEYSHTFQKRAPHVGKTAGNIQPQYYHQPQKGKSV